MVGSGSVKRLINRLITKDPNIKIAIIDKDPAGGVCSIRGCVPSKHLIYAGIIIRDIEHAKNHGIKVNIENINYTAIMQKIQKIIKANIRKTEVKFNNTSQVDYFHGVGTFVDRNIIKINNEQVRGDKILLCLGSTTLIPPIVGLDDIEYHTSKTIFLENSLPKLPRSILIVGGGYIAAELGHFYSAMGSDVTIIGRNPQFLPQEEPEVSQLAEKVLSNYLSILINEEVIKAQKTPKKKQLVLKNRHSEQTKIISGEEVIIATGRSSNSSLLNAQVAGVDLDGQGWIRVNDYLETSQKNIYAFGDANGRFLLKHKANYETEIVYRNAFLDKREKVDYHAIPHAVFTYPEIAAVGLRQQEAVAKYGEEGIQIGFALYEDTVYGRAMEVKDFFVKVIVEKTSSHILGAHIIGPYASLLIQEIITLMYTSEKTFSAIKQGMHIHPSLSQVVERAFTNLKTPNEI
jgi:dihydrolipoamide dehydrogenase